ncbi:hypothetical protein [Lactobacillus bombicola]|uniref:hypothetical protein n=1 Tax=Lactobacillus bombicola TaxID=1505723 RepID=UPI00217523A3|nr:hypothetical protein [Lactobacillus bombicola]
MVKETTDNCWSLPGGLYEPNLSVKDNCIKEAKEEAECAIAIDYLIAIQLMIVKLPLMIKSVLKG